MVQNAEGIDFGELTVVIGLPGAGKSTLVKRMRCSLSGLCIEDFHANAIRNSSSIEDSRHYRALVEAIRAGHSCVVPDIAFCCPQRLSAMKETLAGELPGLRIDYIYFENAPDKCRRNILRRQRPSLKADLLALEKFALTYSIPDDAIPLPVKEES